MAAASVEPVAESGLARTVLQRELSLNKKIPTSRFNKASSKAFLPNAEIASHWMWAIITACVWPLNNWLHRLTFVGIENFEETIAVSGSALTVHLHSTHNTDIALAIIGTYKATGIVCRGLVHRTVMLLVPLLKYFGMVPGERTTAEDLLNANFFVSVIPGGGEEAMRGHENAYNLKWRPDRRGFAKVAIRTSKPIIPMFYANHEEMRFNPVFWLWNYMRGHVAYDAIVEQKIYFVSAAVKLIGEGLWFMSSWMFAIYMPSKVTAYCGAPIYTTSTDDVDVVVAKTLASLKQLIAQHQPNGIDRTTAYEQWIEDRAFPTPFRATTAEAAVFQAAANKRMQERREAKKLHSA